MEMLKACFSRARLTESPQQAPGRTNGRTILSIRVRGMRNGDEDAGLTSQLAVMNNYGNGAIYHSEPFASPQR